MDWDAFTTFQPNRSVQQQENIRQLRMLRAARVGLGLEADANSAAGNGGAADVASIRYAQAALKQLNVELAATERKARRVQQQARSAALDASAAEASTRRTLAERLRSKGFGYSRGKVDMGPVEIGKGGPKLNGSWLRNSGGGAFLVTSAGMNLLAGGLNTWVDAQKRVEAIKKKGGTDAQAREAIGLDLGRSFEETVGSLGPDALAIAIGRAVNGISEDHARSIIRKTRNARWQSQIERDWEGRVQAIALGAAENEVKSQIAVTWNRINRTLPQSFTINKNDLAAFRAEMKRINKGLMDTKEEMALNAVQREHQKRIAAGN